MNIILSGAPFSGKTTIGTLLAHKTGWKFINTDTLLEEAYNLSCSQQFQQFGHKQFRENESSLLQELTSFTENAVLSLGGGTLTYPPNLPLLKKLGKMTYLHCSFHELYSRLLQSGRTPAYLDPKNIETSFKTLLEEREAHYLQSADFVLDVTLISPEKSLRPILDFYALT